jgi:hypothetical protein
VTTTPPPAPKPPPSTYGTGTYAAAAVALAVGFALALLVHYGLDVKTGFKVSSEFSAFATLFVLSLAIERLIQPFTPLLGRNTVRAKRKRDKKVSEARSTLLAMQPLAESGVADEAKAQKVETDLKEANAEQAKVDEARSETSIVAWGVASGLGFLLSAGLGVTLLETIRDPASIRPNYVVDLLVTGLVIGAGTKPLNDLISGIQKSKNKKEDPVETGGK